MTAAPYGFSCSASAAGSCASTARWSGAPDFWARSFPAAMRVERGLAQMPVGLGLGDDQDGGHGSFFPQMTLASFFSLVNSSCTSPTLMPALRGGGADSFTTSTCSVVSTPSAAGVSSSMGLLFAFMMPGSEA